MGLRWSGCFVGFVCVCRVDGSRLVPGFFLFVRVVGSFQTWSHRWLRWGHRSFDLLSYLPDGCLNAVHSNFSPSFLALPFNFNFFGSKSMQFSCGSAHGFGSFHVFHSACVQFSHRKHRKATAKGSFNLAVLTPKAPFATLSPCLACRMSKTHAKIIKNRHFLRAPMNQWTLSAFVSPLV